MGSQRQAGIDKRSTFINMTRQKEKPGEHASTAHGRCRQKMKGCNSASACKNRAAGASLSGTPVCASGVSRGTIKISMMHPRLDRAFVVLELLVNEGITEGL